MTGNRLEDHPSIVNLLWEKKNRPDSFKKIGKALTIDGFVTFRLTGQSVMNQCLRFAQSASQKNSAGQRGPHHSSVSHGRAHSYLGHGGERVAKPMGISSTRRRRICWLESWDSV